ncbi:hypothetical protein Tco_0861366 [Tanacetum coccineum]|uniref:Reverse transcriptase n=1 Tax=Tanacetum coccineum TaxID=301880 RepID=A0ABQ5BLP9_9ASTR
MLAPSGGGLILYQAYGNLYAMTGRKAHLLEDKQIPSVEIFDESVNVMKEAIDKFSAVSGLLPNYAKSTIIFGSMKEMEKLRILEGVPFKVEKQHVKYLGVPLPSKRLQFIASVLESIHIYWASVFLLPQSVINDINKLLKGFLCTQGEMLKGNTKVKWINTEKLKGISIWSVNEEIFNSWGWRNILRLRNDVREFIVIKVGDGSKASAIYDNWCPIGILQSFITHRDLYNDRLDADMVIQDLVKNRNGKEGRFYLSQAYKNLQREDENVIWSRLVWFS